MKTAISAFATLLAFLLYGCTEKAAQSKQLYEMQDFNQGVRSVLDNEGFSIIEFWENASHLEPIPSEIEALHQAIDDGIKAQRSTAHLTADNKEKGTIQLRFWIIGDQVGAVKIDSPDEENSERIKAGLLSRFPDLTIMTENSLTVVQLNRATN
jgi:hypothetical protein